MIYIIQDREAEYPSLKNYEPLYIGKKFNGEYEDNIEHLNPYLNEYTGLYLMWKHKDDDIIGMVHYRRFFTTMGLWLKWKEIEYWLSVYDIIIPPDYRVGMGVYKHLYNEIGTDRDRVAYEKYCNLLFEKEPKLKNWFMTARDFNPRSMFVAKKELIDKYFEWVFPIIIPWAEQFVREDLDKVDNTRIPGYIAERLLAYWVQTNHLTSFRADYFQLDQSWTEE